VPAYDTLFLPYFASVCVNGLVTPHCLQISIELLKIIDGEKMK
jgi:hypothetical protein